MKKLVALACGLLLALGAAFGFAACSDGDTLKDGVTKYPPMDYID